MNIRYCYSHFKSFTLAIWVLASMAWGSLAFSANREMTEAHRQFMGYLHSEPNLRTWEAYLEPQLSDFTASISAAEDAPINLDLATGLKARLNAAVPFIATHKPTLDRFQNMIASLGHYINANRSSLASIQSQLIAAGPTLQATTSLNRYKSLTQARLNTLASLLGPRVDKYIVRAEHKIDLLEKLLSAPILNKDSIEELMSINNALLAQGVLQGEPAIVALQSAVADWLGELESIDNQTFKAQATEHIATLNRFVNQYPGIIESDQAATVAFKESYAWLYAHHQNRPLLAQLRMSIQRADLHISVTSQFIGSFANKSIDMTIPVSSVEEGTTITGQSVINGNISAVTLPSSQSALLRFQFSGTAQTTVQASQSLATAGLYSVSNIAVAIDVNVSELGLNLREPIVNVTTTTQPQWVQSNARLGFIRRIIERIAWRKIQESSGTISAQTSDRIKSEVQKLIDTKLQEGASSILAKIGPKLAMQMQRGQVLPESIGLTTTSAGLLASIRFGHVGKIGSLEIPRSEHFTPGAAFIVAMDANSVSELSNSLRGGPVDSQIISEILGQQSQGQLGRTEMLVPIFAKFSLENTPFAVDTDNSVIKIQINLDKIISQDGEEYNDAKCRIDLQFSTEKAMIGNISRSEQSLLKPISVDSKCKTPEAALVADQFIHNSIPSDIPLVSIKGLKARITSAKNGWIILGWFP